MRGVFWEMYGFYKAGRGYHRQGRVHALLLTLWRGWRD